LELVSGLINAGVYNTVVIVSSEMVSPFSLDFKNDPYTAALFGDAAVAAVVSRTPKGENSKVTLFRMETFGEFRDLATLRGGGSMYHPADPDLKKEHQVFSMDGPKIMEFAVENLPAFFERMELADGMNSFDWIIAHQPSGHGMSFLQHGMGLEDKVVRIFDKFGNNISSSIPNALYEAIKSGKVKRGHRLVLCGTGAGLSIGCVCLTF